MFYEPAMSTKSDFMAAEEIKAILHGRDKAEQERIVRWVSESLGLVATAAQPATVPAASSATAAPAAPASGGRGKDIRTFVNEKKPKSDVQFATVTAYFYRFEAPLAERKDSITATDLQEAGRQARGFGFNKPIVTLSNALQQGYFDRAGRGEFKLNAVGENLVAMTLPGGDGEASGNGQARPRAKRLAKKKAKKKST